MIKRLTLTLLFFVISLNAQNLIPYPQSFTKLGGGYKITSRTVIAHDKRFTKEAMFLRDSIRTLTGFSVRLTRGRKGGVVLIYDKRVAREAYELNISSNGVRIKASSGAGAFYGIQSLRQLLPQGKSRRGYGVSGARIVDSPRFSWRGFMLDCSRSFWEVDEIKKLIETLSYYKFNTLHLHLSDNDGWRLEVSKYPKLTSEGGKGNYRDRGAPVKFYTKEQIKSLISYAKKHHISIVPEIDMPGHASAALRGYREFGVDGGTFNPANPKTYEFLHNILKEAAELFESPFIHFGGDEVGTGGWDKDEHIKKVMADHGFSNVKDVEHHFVKEISSYIESLGKRPVGWGEINDQGAASKKAVIMCWRDSGLGAARRALKEGKEVVLSPQNPLYFDWSYGVNSTGKIYKYDPTSFAEDSQKHLVLGVQANLWTEQVPTTKKMHGMIFPRILALAETSWTNQENKDWDAFLLRLTKHQKVLLANGIYSYDEVGQSEKEFDPRKDVPQFVRPAKITTSMGTCYDIKFAFDGRMKSYFWSSGGPGKGDTVLLELNEPAKVKSVKVYTGDLGKDCLKQGILEISYDGKVFKKVADFVEGNAQYIFNKKTKIKGVRITVSEGQGAWLTLKEIVLQQ